MREQALSERISTLVAHLACTQGEFAARVGLDGSKLSRSLHGTRRFTLAELSRIAEVGGVSTDWLLNGNGVGPGDGPSAPAPIGQSARPEPPAASHREAGEEAAVRAQRREEFLAAAWRLIAEQGYHSVRIADVARLCGTSSAAVHYYFPTKHDVLNDALRFCVEQAFLRQGAELGRISDARRRMLRLIDMQLPRPGQVRNEWSIWLQFWSEAMLHPELRPLHNEFYARWRSTVARVIAGGQRQGVFRADIDVAESALRFTALTDGLAIQLLTGAPDATLERMRRVLVDYVVRELDVQRLVEDQP